MSVYLSHANLRNWSDAGTWREAEAIFRAGGVRDLQMNGSRIRATVGTSGSPVYTRFDIQPDGTVLSDCPCFQSRHQDTVCVHVMAAGMAVAELTEDPCRERRLRITERRSKEAAGRGRPFPRRDPPGTPRAASAAVRVRIPADWMGQLDAGTIRVDIRIVVEGHRMSPVRVRHDRPLVFQKADEALLYVLEDMAGTTVCPPFLSLTPDGFSQLLAEMTGAQIWREGDPAPMAIATEPAVCALRMDMDPGTGEGILTHRTEPDGQVVVRTGRSCWLLADGALYPLECVLPGDLQDAYRGEVRISRMDLIAFDRHRLPALDSRFLMERDPALDALRFLEGTPAFEVHIQGDASEARVSLWAVYGDARYDLAIPPSGEDAAPVPGDPFCFYRRQLPVEQSAQIRFRSRFDEPAGPDGRIRLLGAAAVVNVMSELASVFEQMGWRVCFGDAVAGLARSARWVHPLVTIHPAGTDGDYRIETGYLDEQGDPVSADRVEQALRQDQAVLNDDRRTLLLNVAGLNALASDLAESMVFRDGRAYTSRIHAGFIRAAVAAYGRASLVVPDDWSIHAEAQTAKRALPTAPVPACLARQLRPYQQEGVNWLCFLDQCGYAGILADEMGLGKTVQALAWLQIRRNAARQRDGTAPPAMVVCPTSLIHNWAREVERFTPDMSYRVVSGNIRQRLLENPGDYDLIITSYALLRRDIARYDGMAFSAVVLDEAQHIKNRSTQNAVAAKRLKGARRLVLTGTPIENSVNDLWSIMDFLMPGHLGTHTRFRIRFEQPIAAVGTPQAERALDRLRMKMDPFMLRRLKTAVAADLPEKVTRIADCPMTPAQRRIYRRLLAESHDNLQTLVSEQGFERSRFSVFSALLRLRQCCCHPALLKKTGLADDAESGKMDLFLELLDEAIDGGHRVLVFSQFVQMLHLLRDTLRKRSIPFAYLDGSTRDRMAQVDAFNQNPGIPVFLVSLKAGGSGLNLTGANVVIHYDPWWNPAVEDQATDRTHRIGQSRTVYSIKLVTRNSIEEKVVELQQRKRAVIEAAMGTGSSVEQALNWEDVQELLRHQPD